MELIQTFTTVIANVGFPIFVSCGCLWFFIKKDQKKEQIDTEEKKKLNDNFDKLFDMMQKMLHNHEIRIDQLITAFDTLKQEVDRLKATSNADRKNIEKIQERMGKMLGQIQMLLEKMK